MRFIAGLVLGLVMGLTAAASAANLVWFSGTQILTKSAEFQSGYVAGVYDGVAFGRNLVSYGIDIKADARVMLNQLDNYLACMNRNSDNLGQFRNWAVLQWTSFNESDNYSGAAVMLTVECVKR